MKDSRKPLSGQRGSSATEYAVLLVLLTILMLLSSGRGPIPDLGINNPLGGILNGLNGIMSTLSGLFRGSVPRIRSPIQFR